MAPSVEALLKHSHFNPDLLERISFRTRTDKLAIVEPDASWPQKFNLLKERIESALGPVAVSVTHVGSTSVPGLPAKNVIDIDVTVQDVADEASYVAPLEAAGFQFLIREPRWHGHRLFCCYEPSVNLHVWGPDCPEAERHLIFRDWLRRNEDDRELYAQTKRVAAEQSSELGENVMQYNFRKEGVIREIIERAFKDLGYM